MDKEAAEEPLYRLEGVRVGDERMRPARVTVGYERFGVEAPRRSAPLGCRRASATWEYML